MLIKLAKLRTLVKLRSEDLDCLNKRFLSFFNHSLSHLFENSGK